MELFSLSYYTLSLSLSLFGIVLRTLSNNLKSLAQLYFTYTANRLSISFIISINSKHNRHINSKSMLWYLLLE